MAWHQNLGDVFSVVPTVRYYSQSAADFFTNLDNFLLPLPEYQSSDYRLSAFGAISLAADLGEWITTLTVERYLANEKYSAFEVNQPSTSLVKYFRVSLRIEYSF